MKKRVLLFIYIFFSIATAQSNISNETSVDELIKSYSKFIYKDASKALVYVMQAKDLAAVQRNEKQLSEVHYYIAKCYNRLGENKKALTNVEIAISKGIVFNDTVFLYNYFFLKGTIFSELGDDSKSLIAYLKAMEYAKEIKNPIYEISLLSNIAHIKKSHKDFNEAIDLYKELLKRLEGLPENQDTKINRLVALMNIADSYLWVKNTDVAAVYNEMGLKKCSATNMPWAYYPMLMNKAIILYQKEKYSECVSITKEINTYALKAEKEALYLTSIFYLGKSAYKLQAYQKSIQYLEQALDLINGSDNVDINEKELHEFLALGYNKIGDSKKSLLHFEIYAALEKKQSAEDLKINNETHQLVDIVPLKIEIDELGVALTKQTKNKKWFIISSIFLLGLLISSIVYYKIRENRTRTKFKELMKKVSELENNEEKKEVPKKAAIIDDKMKVLLDKISDFEDKEYYLLQECSLGFMAEKLETNTSYLSKAINRYRGKSFTTYITELRINTALIKVKNNKLIQSYTIKAIAEEFGFKRQETFAKAFKFYTGIYPSQYVKNLKKEA